MTDCINHVGSSNDGYGVLKIGRKTVRAHRAAYCKANDKSLAEIASLVVMHSCDNRLCVNPNHLSVGTHADNCADKVNKGRQAKGESIGVSKLTTQQVRVIKGLIERGHNNAEIGRCYQVSVMCISRIRNGKTWGHV